MMPLQCLPIGPISAAIIDSIKVYISASIQFQS